MSLKFVSKGPVNNIPALIQIMAWRRPGDKPLSEPMMVSLLTHISVTRTHYQPYSNIGSDNGLVPAWRQAPTLLMHTSVLLTHISVIRPQRAKAKLYLRWLWIASGKVFSETCHGVTVMTDGSHCAPVTTNHCTVFRNNTLSEIRQYFWQIYPLLSVDTFIT